MINLEILLINLEILKIVSFSSNKDLLFTILQKEPKRSAPTWHINNIIPVSIALSYLKMYNALVLLTIGLIAKDLVQFHFQGGPRAVHALNGKYLVKHTHVYEKGLSTMEKKTVLTVQMKATNQV